ncbi:hypothetical protein [Peptostreptococcus russellii]|uniref:hypothetical protein n=1 Tax=Peptostreptococcus russellii TaxID=215200 RepID=UPI003F58FE64
MAVDKEIFNIRKKVARYIRQPFILYFLINDKRYIKLWRKEDTLMTSLLDRYVVNWVLKYRSIGKDNI